MKGKDIELGQDYAIGNPREGRPWCKRKRCVGKGLSFSSRYYKDQVRESSGESLFVRVDEDGSGFPPEAPTEVARGHQDKEALRKVESHTHAQVLYTWAEYEQKQAEWKEEEKRERESAQARKEEQKERVQEEIARLQTETEALARIRELGFRVCLPNVGHYGGVYEGQVEGSIEALIALLDHIRTLEEKGAMS